MPKNPQSITNATRFIERWQAQRTMSLTVFPELLNDMEKEEFCDANKLVALKALYVIPDKIVSNGAIYNADKGGLVKYQKIITKYITSVQQKVQETYTDASKVIDRTPWPFLVYFKRSDNKAKACVNTAEVFSYFQEYPDYDSLLQVEPIILDYNAYTYVIERANYLDALVKTPRSVPTKQQIQYTIPVVTFLPMTTIEDDL